MCTRSQCFRPSRARGLPWNFEVRQEISDSSAPSDHGIAAQPLLTPAQLHRIDCPALVVCGDRDPFVPPEHAAGLARQLPAGRLFVAPDCGHEVPARRPGLFNEAISAFYRSTEAEARTRAARVETAGVPVGHPIHEARPTT